MMHRNSFVATIKTNGKFLREHNSEIRLPFGTEYSIFLKNLNSCKALVSIQIDGQDISNGLKFILNPNENYEIERFIKNGNMHEGNRFKFIERTEAIEKHRGVQPEDGLIRVEFWKEEVIPPINIRYEPYWDRRRYDRRSPFIPERRRFWQSKTAGSNAGSSVRGMHVNSSSTTFLANTNSVDSSSLGSVTTCSLNSVTATAASFNETGITAPGGYSGQVFTWGSSFPTETQSTVIVLHLKGEVEGKAVTVVRTTKQKVVCSTCGKKNSSEHDFCSGCGTALKIYA